MIRQSTKTDRELYLKYLDLCGANPSSYKLQDYYDSTVFYEKLWVADRQQQVDAINKINHFDGMCYILVKFDGNERVEDYTFLNNLIVYWDHSKEAKRIKRIKKVRSRMKS